MSVIACLRCNRLVSRNAGGHIFCLDCLWAREAERAKALRPIYEQVRKAVLRGEIPPVRTQRCMDCDRQAQCYDHRDYSRPLDVEPVCRGCNSRRRTAANHPYPSLDSRWNRPSRQLERTA